MENTKYWFYMNEYLIRKNGTNGKLEFYAINTDGKWVENIDDIMFDLENSYVLDYPISEDKALAIKDKIDDFRNKKASGIKQYNYYLFMDSLLIRVEKTCLRFADPTICALFGECERFTQNGKWKKDLRLQRNFRDCVADYGDYSALDYQHISKEQAQTLISNVSNNDYTL